jgi:hypothetical protein
MDEGEDKDRAQGELDEMEWEMYELQVQAKEYKKKNDELAIEAEEKEAALAEADRLRKEQLGEDFDDNLEEMLEAREERNQA